MVRVLVGTEPYRMKLQEQKLISGRAMTQISSIGAEAEQALQSTGLFGDSGIIYETDSLKKEDELFRLCKEYHDSNSLILIKCREVLGTTKFAKWLKQNKCLIDCGKLEMDELRSFILRGCKKYGVQLTESVLDEIIRRSGYLTDDQVNAYKISMLVKQLSFCHQPVTMEDVDVLVEEMPESNAFRLSDCFVAKDLSGFLNEAHILAANGEDFIRVTSLLYRNFRILYKIHTLQEMDEKKMRESLGLNWYAWKNMSSLRKLDNGIVIKVMDILERGMTEMRKNSYMSETLFIGMMGKLALLI